MSAAAAESVRPIHVLMVEDNPGDVRLVKESMRKSKILNRISVVSNGDAALAFLRKRNGYEHEERPDLVLLDLNLPGRSGREVLAEIKSDPELKSIPVCVITSSQHEQDILESYQNHANCYITKPVDLAQFEKIVRSIEEFWFSIVTLPPHAV